MDKQQSDLPWKNWAGTCSKIGAECPNGPSRSSPFSWGSFTQQTSEVAEQLPGINVA